MCDLPKNVHCTKTYNYDMDTRNIGIFPQTGRHLTTVKYQLLLPNTNWTIKSMQRFIYLLVSLTNITMTEDSIRDYFFWVKEATVCTYSVTVYNLNQANAIHIQHAKICHTTLFTVCL